jgi:hypothetical protein
MSAQTDAMTTFDLEDYLASVDLPLLAQSLAESWGWLEPLRELRPFALSLAGDVFLMDWKNATFFLDTNFGIVERIASGNDAFRARLQNEEFARAILRMDFVHEVRSRKIRARHNEVYGLALSPYVGGAVRADTARAMNFRVYFELLGQLTHQTKDLPVGQHFCIGFSGWPHDPPPSQGTVRKQPRDRPSFLDG